MCGIHVTISRHGFKTFNESTANLLRRRGPDSLETQTLEVRESPTHKPIFVTLTSTVLSLRGDHVVRQPIVGALSAVAFPSVLCWNGEAWSFAGTPIAGNDGEQVCRALQHVTQNATDHGSSPLQLVAHALSSFAGPYAFVFLDLCCKALYFGRDFLGRRSLMRATAANGDIVLCSVAASGIDCSIDAWTEVEADGIYGIDLTSQVEDHHFEVRHVPYHYGDSGHHYPLMLQLPKVSPSKSSELTLTLDSPAVGELERHLRNALKPRLHPGFLDKDKTASIAILFSGGLDCTVLARLANDLLPIDQPIDLLNVAFENPRVHAACEATDASPYELCPDRRTGRSSHKELQTVCPGRRWRFVAVDVPYKETLAHRETVISLIHPHNTEMDLSIACALFFAARGQGSITQDDGLVESYTSPARVLLSGLGADELLGGYSRHAIAYERRGLDGLVDELQLDVARLGKRNLGRDDRVISHWGREARFPFLDEIVVRWALETPVWTKCGFGQDHSKSDFMLEPGKLVLRCLAWRLGMHSVAKEKKRAIQFGARTAKMETGRSKGAQVLGSAVAT